MVSWQGLCVTNLCVIKRIFGSTLIFSAAAFAAMI